VIDRLVSPSQWDSGNGGGASHGPWLDDLPNFKQSGEVGYVATRFVRWAQSHPIIAGVLIVFYYSSTLNQDYRFRSFTIATAILAGVVTLLVLWMKVEQRE
jgi:hypothetical protein